MKQRVTVQPPLLSTRHHSVVNIILYGSVARGTQTEESDVDIETSTKCVILVVAIQFQKGMDNIAEKIDASPDSLEIFNKVFKNCTGMSPALI